jgi:hypothetical protein
MIKPGRGCVLHVVAPMDLWSFGRLVSSLLSGIHRASWATSGRPPCATTCFFLPTCLMAHTARSRGMNSEFMSSTATSIPQLERRRAQRLPVRASRESTYSNFVMMTLVNATVVKTALMCRTVARQQMSKWYCRLQRVGRREILLEIRSRYTIKNSSEIN